MKRIGFAVVVVTVCMAMGCALIRHGREEGPAPPSGATLLRQLANAHAVLDAVDTTVDPCTDFYAYVCNPWLAKTTLPADKPIYTRSFSVIGERNEQILRRILEEPAVDAAHAKITTFYASCMNEPAITKAGVEPVEALLGEIGSLTSVADAFVMAARLQWVPGASPFLAFYVGPDFKDPRTNILNMAQGGLGLPDREYYLDPEHRDILEAYRRHVAAMLSLAGIDAKRADADADHVVDLETALARVSKPPVALRDVEKRYHRVDRAGLVKLASALPWGRYFEALKHPDLSEINVMDPDFFAALDDIVGRAPLDTLIAYLRWSLVDAVAGYLSDPFVDASFAFASKLTGQAQIRPRWKRCISATTQALPDLVGRRFVAEQFGADSKAIAREMIGTIEEAFVDGLAGVGWMDEATRAAARDKARAIANKVGYPDKWIDYSRVEIEPDRYFDDVAAATRFDLARDLAKVGKPVDRSEWDVPASMVNAFYSPSDNEMVFPAGVLQPPLFDRTFPLATSYGAIGAVMGHELTHGFDDEGRKFDARGRLRQWWSPEVAERFEKRTQCLVDLYDGFEIEPGVAVNGKLTLGENIADLGGIKLAHRAYEHWAAEHPAAAAEFDDVSPDRLLFLSYARTWCTKSTPQFGRLLAKLDPHAPARYRVNGVLRDVPAFGEAFGCKVGTPMRPERVCEVW